MSKKEKSIDSAKSGHSSLPLCCIDLQKLFKVSNELVVTTAEKCFVLFMDITEQSKFLQILINYLNKLIKLK